jgi:preprotein translocase subunit SecE
MQVSLAEDHQGMWARITTFFREVRSEFGRVTWPSRQELIGSTGVVLVFSVAFAAFIGMFDLIIAFIWGVLLGQ